MSDALWISWAPPHRRTRELADALGMGLHEVYRKVGPLRRYAHAVAGTLMILGRERPRLVFVQVPSLVLGVVAVVLSRVFRFRLVADQHNETIEPFHNRSPWYRRVCDFVIRRAHLNIVTNDALARVVESRGGRAFVLPDRVPRFGALERADLGPGRHIVFVCSFAADEPYLEVVEAARRLPPGVTMHITGGYYGIAPMDLPANARTTGYLPVEDYVNLLFSADVVLDLTLMENCLVCGAYEAVALHKPLVTSDTAALRAHFGDAALYCRGDRDSIAAALLQALDRLPELGRAAAAQEPLLRSDWDRKRDALVAALGGVPHAA